MIPRELLVYAFIYKHKPTRLTSDELLGEVGGRRGDR